MTTHRAASCALAMAALLFGGGLLHAGEPEIWVGAGPTCDYASLQDAIDSLPTDGSNTIIRIANDQPYVGQLSVVDRSVSLVGGFSDCDGTDNGERTVIDADGAPGPAIVASQTLGVRSLRLIRVDVVGGNGVDGGGLAVGSLMYVDLLNTRIYGNAATRGGGLFVDGTGGETLVDIDYNSRIGDADSPNTAVEGAGVFCDHASLRIRHGIVSYNLATGNGGGLHLDACTLDSIGVDPATEGNRLDYNTAAFGGAIYAIDASAITLGAEGGRTDFTGNEATQSGGAIHLAGDDSTAVLIASRFESNSAGLHGGALYVVDHGYFHMRRGYVEPALCPEFPCSALISNTAGIDGSAGYARAGGRLEIEETVVAGDGAPSQTPVLFATGTGTFLRISNVLLHGLAGEGVRVGEGAHGVVLFATFAGNAFTADVHLGPGAPVLHVESSIVWDAPSTVLALDDASATVTTYCNTVHDAASLPGDTEDPRFVDAAAHDFRLRGDSPVIDACGILERKDGPDGVFVFFVDVAGGYRPVDLVVPDIDGPYDRGAFELQDLIFADGFD